MAADAFDTCNLVQADAQADVQPGEEKPLRIADLDGALRALGDPNALLVDGDGLPIDVVPWDHEKGCPLEIVPPEGFVCS